MNEGLRLDHTPAGIPVLVESVPSSRSVAFAVYVRAGSRHETDRPSGTAHLLEHLLFRGTRYRTSRGISEEMENAGGELNGFTAKEYTCFFSSILSETFPVGRDILSDILTRPSLEEDHFRLEKGIVSQEVNMLLNEPDSYIHSLFSKAIWDGHPMAIPEAGDSSTIDHLTLEDVQDFYRSHYRTGNMTVVASGDADPDDVIEWASELDELGGGPGGEDQNPPRPRAEVRVFPREGDQAYVGLGFPGFRARSPRRQPQRLLCVVLGAGMSSRLFQRVREEEGLVYSIYSLSQHYSDCGALGVYFSTTPDNTVPVVRSVVQEVSRLKGEGLEKGELERAKRLVKGVLVRRLESTEHRMFRLGEHFLATGEVTTLDDILDQVNRVTEDEVMGVADELLVHQRLCMAVHGPMKELDPGDLDF
ncbi:MAG: M16 family metallopeptidase [Methanomassiliicoccales archaeon]